MYLLFVFFLHYCQYAIYFAKIKRLCDLTVLCFSVLLLGFSVVTVISISKLYYIFGVVCVFEASIANITARLTLLLFRGERPKRDV